MGYETSDDLSAWLQLMRRSCSRMASAAGWCVANCGLNLPQYNALSIIRERGRITMGALSKEMGVTFGAGTNLMERLVVAGYVDRVRDNDDRRIVRVMLTPKGTELMKECDVTLSQLWSGPLGRLDPAKRAEFFAAYRLLLDTLDRSELPKPSARREVPRAAAAVAG